MTTRVALLRGINVGGHNKVAMAALRAFVSDLGIQDVRSLLQTGNLVFRIDGKAPAGLERLLEAEAARRLGLSTVFMVRTADEWRDLIAGNPFPEVAARDPGHLILLLLKDEPAGEAVSALQDANKGPEVIRAGERHLYLHYAGGIGRSKLTNQLIESKLATRATGRNWNTVLKLAELCSG